MDSVPGTHSQAAAARSEGDGSRATTGFTRTPRATRAGAAGAVRSSMSSIHVSAAGPR